MSTYKGIVKTNKLTGSPVGVTIAEMINIKIKKRAKTIIRKFLRRISRNFSNLSKFVIQC